MRLVVSDAHVGLTKAIRRQRQGCVWQRCRVHYRFAEGFAYARNLLQRVPRAHQGMVTAALRSVFAQESAGEILSRWDDLATSLAERFPRAAVLMAEAREDVLAFRHFPQQHWRKIWSTNLLERLIQHKPERYGDGHLRTLQRRLRGYRLQRIEREMEQMLEARAEDQEEAVPEETAVLPGVKQGG